MKTIVITGPEASGKSVLSSKLASLLNCAWSEEYAREYLQRIRRPYNEEDLTHIAQEQEDKRKTQMALSKSEYHILDTDFLVLYIWSMEKYGRVSDYIDEGLKTKNRSLYLLCKPDLPWVEDPLRENPHDRDRLFALYERELNARKLPYQIIEGADREKPALKYIQDHFK